MKVILIENLPPLGAAGAVVEVTRGYARNYLIPQGKALEATAGNLSRFESQRARLVQQAAKEKDAALELAARLAEVSLTIPQRVGESERLYGSVTNAVIAQALEEKGFALDRRQLELDEPIKRLGSYLVSVRLAPEVKAQVRVEVVPESA